MKIKDIKNKKGTTLLEIVVAVAIFSIIIVMVVGIFQSVITSQQSAVATQNQQESLKYIFEVISKDIRSAIRGDATCNLGGDAATTKIFNKETTLNPDSDVLYFKDKDGVCTYYYINNGVFVVDKGGTVSSTSPKNVLVKAFNFSIVDNTFSPDSNLLQPMVTFSLETEGRGAKNIEKQTMTVQTTISSRYYE